MAGERPVVAPGVVVLLLCCLAAPMVRGGGGGGGVQHNITSFLNGHPEYKLYNKYLTETRVCDEINARAAVTCLVLNDGAMATLVADAGESSLAGIKAALRLHSLLDYWDTKKLRSLTTTNLTDTFFQAAGDAMGTVKIAKLDSGDFGFASANKGAKFDATLVKAVKQTPYDFAVLEISAPIEFDGLFDVPDAANLTRLLEKAGCKRFAALVAGNPGVLKAYQAAMATGLTLFAPNDDAFVAKAGTPDVGKMEKDDLVRLLMYHAVPAYEPKPSLKLVKAGARPLRTLASTAAGEYNVTVVARGDDVSLDTGVRKSRVAATVLDEVPLCVLTVDSLLMPVELFADAPMPAPAPAPAMAPADAPLGSSSSSPADAPSEVADHKAKHVKSTAAALRSIGAVAVALCSVVFASLL